MKSWSPLTIFPAHTSKIMTSVIVRRNGPGPMGPPFFLTLSYSPGNNAGAHILAPRMRKKIPPNAHALPAFFINAYFDSEAESAAFQIESTKYDRFFKRKTNPIAKTFMSSTFKRSYDEDITTKFVHSNSLKVNIHRRERNSKETILAHHTWMAYRFY